MFSQMLSHGPLRVNYRRVAIASVVSAIASSQTLSADVHKRDPVHTLPLSAVLRAYTVYTLCSFPPLVSHAPSLLGFLSSIPGLKQVTESIVRATFFAQFVGGETVSATLPLLHRLRDQNKGAILNYSVEVDEKTAVTHSEAVSLAYKRQVQQIIESIELAGDFDDARAGPIGRKTWVAVKPTALVRNAQSLANLSAYLVSARPNHTIPYPGTPYSSDLATLSATSNMDSEDIHTITELHSDLIRICEKARERGVRVLIDAEYSWYQPAIDALTLSLSMKFNVPTPSSPVQPLVYATYQAYLRRNYDHLLLSLQDAGRRGYSLGVKLVRGAYHSQELAASTPSVWTDKSQTDECFDNSLSLLLTAIKSDLPPLSDPSRPPRVAVVFGTHNWDSCNQVLRGLVKQGLAKQVNGTVSIGQAVSERIQVAQLYGMCDALTEHMSDNIRSPFPVVSKYIPYGAVSEVMPYLGRRAMENKSVLGGKGGAADERTRMGRELWRRFKSMTFV